MAEFLIPSGGTLSEDTTSAEFLLPGGGTISVEVAAPAAGDISNLAGDGGLAGQGSLIVGPGGLAG